MSTVSKLLIVIVFLVVGSVGAMTARLVFVVDESTDIPVPEINGFVLQQPRVLPEFALLDGHARAFARSDFEGAWSLLYFGFTYCPDICPTAMVEMAKLKNLLAASRPDVTVEYYLVSVDPQRDTPERIQEYVTYFDDSFKGLTGDLLEIGKLAQTASVIHVIEPS
ncbi:MAG: SCO family protein, partial [Pseudohongiella sp.]|nr:SCO family protein [Pseudohongiella sp.]